jgi:hypothetical protein
MGRTNAQMIEELQELLRANQWSGAPVKTPQHRMEPTCPSCRWWGTHDPTCKLADALTWKANDGAAGEPEPTAEELGAAARKLEEGGY